MYRINLQNITGLLPAKMIKNNSYFSFSYLFSNLNLTKNYWSLITAFLVLPLLFFLSGCDNEGIVGEEIDSGEERVETTEINSDQIEVISDTGYAGRLNNTAMGIVEDPIFGNIHSVALLKPSINVENLEEFSEDDELQLRLELNSLKYGDENVPSEYEIYEIDQLWRANELRYNTTVSYDESNLLGSFQVGDEDEIDVDLDQGWVNRYRNYFNDDSEERDSLYREFRGIAIVPAAQNRKIDFLRFESSEEDTTDEDTTESQITRFQVRSAEEDSVVANISINERGASMERTGEPGADDTFHLHNTMENILKVNLDVDSEQFAGQEIVNAQLLLHTHPGEESGNPPGFTRPNTDLIRAHAFESEPLDLASEIFTSAPRIVSQLNEDEELFQVNVTDYFIINFYEDSIPLYFTIQGNNGLFYSTRFYGVEAPENLRPKLIITTINSEN